MTHAFKDGIARAVSAPSIVAGTVAVIWLLSLPLPEGAFDATAGLRAMLAAVVIWSFAWGGILDRYARNRPTRGRGFFGACGAHLPALLRLGVVFLLIDAAIGWAAPAKSIASSAVAETAYAVLATVVWAVATFARIRIVIEDRRSALGATLGAVRFLWRNPAGIGLVVVFAVLETLALVALTFAVNPDPAEGWRRALAEGSTMFLILVEHAAGVALFQSRLAHATYTAAPPIEWPDSPAAEAITNRIPGTAP